MTDVSINLHPSKLLMAVVSLIHLGALLCVLLLGFSVWVEMPVIAVIVCSYYYNLKRYVLLQSKKSIVKIWHKEAATWYLQNRAGEVLQKQLRANSFISRYLILLNFVTPVVLCVDSASRDRLRLLRVHLLTSCR